MTTGRERIDRLRRYAPSVREALLPRLVHDLGAAREASQSLRQWRAAYRAHLHLVTTPIPPGATFLDVGANIGDWTSDVLRTFPRSRVIAIEPGSEPQRTFNERVGGDSRVELVPVPVAEEAGLRRFHVTSHSHNASLHRPRNMDAHYGSGWEISDVVELEATTLDVVAAGLDIAVMKLDVQGAELEVLEGATDALQRTNAVIMEVTFVSHYESDASFAKLDSHMLGLGFAMTGLTAAHRSRDGLALWSDAVYCRPSPTRVASR